MANPMEQFSVETITPLVVAGYDVSFTNSSLWMVIALAAVSVFLFVGTARPQLVPGRMQAATEYLYDFVRKMMDENVGPEGRRYAPLIFSVFIFVLASNLLGMIPWVGGVHSHQPHHGDVWSGNDRVRNGLCRSSNGDKYRKRGLGQTAIGDTFSAYL